MNNFKNISLIVVSAIILFIIAQFLFIEKEVPKVEIPYQLTHTIDSLNAENAKLQRETKSLDSIIERYKFQISILDSEIVFNQSKFDTAKKKAGIKINKVKGYTLDEVDSFFKDRYNY
jgi:hypothetical protein